MISWIPLTVSPDKFCYRAMIGVGGIGSGRIFAVKGDSTLGREESRSGSFLDAQDYCKLHIIAHYIQVLLGPGFLSLPIGFVGNDEPGRRLLEEMAQAGMDLRYVKIDAQAPTMYSICIMYPDGSGGNLTEDDSASELVSPEIVEASRGDFAAWKGRGIALAAPEVSLESRDKLLELGKEYGFFNVLAVDSTEAGMPYVERLFEKTDFLALNLHEAASILNSAYYGAAFYDAVYAAYFFDQRKSLEAYKGSTKEIVFETVRLLSNFYVGMAISISAGKEGSWVYDGDSVHHCPALDVQVTSSAGAGDCYLAGMLVGLTAGLSLFEAQELGTLAAALAVTSPHTIHPGVDQVSLRELAVKTGVRLSKKVLDLLGMESDDPQTSQ